MIEINGAGLSGVSGKEGRSSGKQGGLLSKFLLMFEKHLLMQQKALAGAKGKADAKSLAVAATGKHLTANVHGVKSIAQKGIAQKGIAQKSVAELLSMQAQNPLGKQKKAAKEQADDHAAVAAVAQTIHLPADWHVGETAKAKPKTAHLRAITDTSQSSGGKSTTHSGMERQMVFQPVDASMQQNKEAKAGPLLHSFLQQPTSESSAPRPDAETGNGQKADILLTSIKAAASENSPLAGQAETGLSDKSHSPATHTQPARDAALQTVAQGNRHRESALDPQAGVQKAMASGTEQAAVKSSDVSDVATRATGNGNASTHLPDSSSAAPTKQHLATTAGKTGSPSDHPVQAAQTAQTETAQTQSTQAGDAKAAKLAEASIVKARHIAASHAASIARDTPAAAAAHSHAAPHAAQNSQLAASGQPSLQTTAGGDTSGDSGSGSFRDDSGSNASLPDSRGAYATGDARSGGSVNNNFQAHLASKQLPSMPVLDALQHIAHSAANGKKQIDLQLEPAHLGKIHISLQTDASKQLQIFMVADQPASRHAIEQQLPILRQALADQGFSLANFHMGSQGEQPSFGSGDQQGGQSSPGMFGAVGSPGESAAPPSVSQASGSGSSRLSIHI